MKKNKNIYNNLEAMNKEIHSLRSEIEELKNNFLIKESLYKNHLLRVASNENIDINSIFFNMPYVDLSPQEAFKVYNKQSYNFIVLDVSAPGFSYSESIKESLRVELEFLEMKINELPSKSTPIYVISEQGVRSILACEILYKLGFININNISGGHKFWPGHKSLALAA